MQNKETVENKRKVLVEREDLLLQFSYIDSVRGLADGEKRYALVETYGCQQNEKDTERIRGMLLQMGYQPTESRDEADVIILNTCAVREHAEQRIFGILGSLQQQKRKKESLLIGVCGCMVQQTHIAEDIRKKYRHVDLLFGTHALHRLPQNLYTLLTEGGRIFDTPESDGVIAEGLPILRTDPFRAMVSVMYGCNNFCSYCIVPYVRGRERSRAPRAILDEVRGLVADGVKEITLLGQNVNSYNSDVGSDYGFPELLSDIADIEGDFRIRFMTSHPKDCSTRLLEVMAAKDKVCKHLHLPFQSGSDRILKKMNRKYTSEEYLSIIGEAKRLMPDVTLTSDVIVGFPTETEEDFEDTLDLIKRVEFDGLFTYIYSPRKGTPAAVMEGQVDKTAKGERMRRLIDLQVEQSSSINRRHVGKTVRVLSEGPSKAAEGFYTGRSDGNKIVNFREPVPAGEYADVYITSALNWALEGTIKKKEE